MMMPFMGAPAGVPPGFGGNMFPGFGGVFP